MAEQADTSKKSSVIKYPLFWVSILLVHLLLLFATGYIAFIPQNFNDPTLVIKSLENDGRSELINQLVVKHVDSDLAIQDLASQSFNIVLGALLAFLSASTNMIFNGSSNITPEMIRQFSPMPERKELHSGGNDKTIENSKS